MKSTTTPKDIPVVSGNAKASNWNYIFKMHSDLKTAPCVKMLTPVNQDFLRQTEKEPECVGVRRKYNGMCWTISKHIMSLMRLKTVHCDDGGKTAETKQSEVTSPIYTDTTGRRRYKLVQEEVEEFLESETPIERLKRSFKRNDFTKKYQDDIQVMRTSLNFVFILITSYGLSLGSKEALLEFRRRNRFTLYTNNKAMYRRLTGTLIIEGVKMAVRYNVKYMGVVLPAVLIEKSVSIYRNKSSPLHMGLGFGITGAVNRYKLGPKGMFGGGVIAGTFGLMLGTVFYVFISYLGFTQDVINMKAVHELVKLERSFRRPEPRYENFDDELPYVE